LLVVGVVIVKSGSFRARFLLFALRLPCSIDCFFDSTGVPAASIHPLNYQNQFPDASQAKNAKSERLATKVRVLP
jgi:hypothetical protein